MDEERNKRPVKKVENPVREWISDNLRYIMLIGGIALVVIIAFVLFTVLGSKGGQNTASNKSDVKVTAEPSVTAEPTKAPEATVTPEVTAEPTETPAPSQEAQEDAAAQESTGLSESGEDVSSVVTRFFNSLSQGNADETAQVVDGISSEDLAAVSEHSYGESYENIKVYSYPGDADGTYVAFARYDYKYPGYDTYLPALTQLYLITGQDGSIKIASDAVQNEKADYLNSVLENSDVKDLVDNVKQQYDAALASDPALAEYVSSMN